MNMGIMNCAMCAIILQARETYSPQQCAALAAGIGFSPTCTSKVMVI